MSDGAGAAFCFLFLYGVSLALQGAGIFTTHWIELSNNQSKCSRGLIFKSGCNQEVWKDSAKVDQTGLILQTVSAGILLAALLLIIINWCCCCDDKNFDSGPCGCFMGFFVFISPATGFMILIGCCTTATQHSNSELGISFYLCLVAGINIVFVTGCLVCLFCCHCCCGKSKSGQVGTVVVASTTGFFKLTRKTRYRNFD